MENDSYLSDLTPFVGPVSYVGRNLTRILYDLQALSSKCRGKVLLSSKTGQPPRVQVTRILVEQMFTVYTQLRGYNFSVTLTSLLNELSTALAMSVGRSELTLNSNVLYMITNVNSDIAISIGKVWNGVPPLRLLNGSGSNADVTIIGDDNILTRMLRKLPGEARVELTKLAQVSGQLAGVRVVRQKDVTTLLADQLFSRSSGSIDLARIFVQMNKQATVLSQFKTDFLMTPLSRFHDLGRPLFIEIDLVLTKADSNSILSAPSISGEVLFTIRSTADVELSFSILRGETSTIIKLQPYSHVQRFGEKVTFPTGKGGILVTATGDLRNSVRSGQRSLIEMGIEGTLGQTTNTELSRWFYQIVTPILPYLPGIVSMLTTSQPFNSVTRVISPEVSLYFQNLKPSFYEDLLTTGTTPADKQRRVLVAYTLILLIPEYLLNPVITLNNVNETPPFMSMYGALVGHFRQIYE
ncbi:hypothetical protein [Operophtera brumata reovirus]|uniref:hypothetical protein n=1 Tax=Operophtera brumata reovirus TaxID=352248 RepID=UPI00005D683D|nr:hypothetical protein [Operophtera brumata reovirus]ABB17212.1 unknown [Operophtera brumata reovirus]